MRARGGGENRKIKKRKRSDWTFNTENTEVMDRYLFLFFNAYFQHTSFFLMKSGDQ